MNIKVAKIGELKPGQGRPIEIAGRSLALFNVNGTYFAVDDSCSHMGAPLCQGMLGGKTITCEWHGATFNLETGAAECAPARGDIQSYKVTVNGDDVEVEIDLEASTKTEEIS